MDQKSYSSLFREYSELVNHEIVLRDDELICECFLVSVADIKNAISNQDIDISDQESFLSSCSEYFELGTGCGSCLKNHLDWTPAFIENRNLSGKE